MSELASTGGDFAESYPDGKDITVEIIRIDGHDRRISLSEKGATERSGNEASAEDYLQRQGGSSARLGDVMGDLSKKLGLPDRKED